jgi:integrase
VRAYASDWRDFAAWCRAVGRSALPASTETVRLYAVDQLDSRRVSTVERRLAAIAARHREQGHGSPVDDDVRTVMQGARRQRGAAPQQKAAVTVEQLRGMVRELPQSARGARDRAILLLGFATGLRRSELAALNLADVVVTGKGVRVTVRRSKTDQEGEGRVIGVFPGRRAATCPVRAVRRWLYVRRGAGGDALFTIVDPGDRVTSARLSGCGIGAVVQRSAARIGLDPREYGGHSLRAGCVTAAAEAGVPESIIMNRTGHRSHAMLVRYLRPASVWSVDPLAGAL